MQVKLSYEEQIINALGHLIHKRNYSTREWTELQFNTIRNILNPLYEELDDLKVENKYLKEKYES
jgi:hypothetical protein